MAKKETSSLQEKLSKLSMGEVLEIAQATDIVFDYYDNMFKATLGDYTDNNTEDNATFKALREKYLYMKEQIFNEIKERVDKLKD